jgi:hypothetical protein
LTLVFPFWHSHPFIERTIPEKERFMDALSNAVDYGIIGLLLALSVWSVAIAVERFLYYRRIDLAQFHSQQTLEIALTKRLVVIGTVARSSASCSPFTPWGRLAPWPSIRS